MSARFDVIVIGVGAMGSSACYHLAKRGVRVLGIEQFNIAHGLGSSGGQTRMIRLAYYEHPDYVPLLRRAYQLWDELEAESGKKLLHRTGGLYMGAPGAEFIAGSLRSAKQYGLPHEELSRANIARRFPQFTLPENYIGMYEPEAGFLLSELAIATHVDLARRHGAEIHDNEKLIRFTETKDGVTVTTDRGTFEAKRIIFTTGAWTTATAPPLPVELIVTRQIMGWVTPHDAALFQLGRFPCWAIEAEPTGRAGYPGVYYGMPMRSGETRLKIARHLPGPRANPDTIDRTPHAEDEQDFRPALQRYLPAADGPLDHMHICMYTISPDSHFVIDGIPATGDAPCQAPTRLSACGFSGHGFKFASVIGEVLADLATRGGTDLPVGFISSARFGPLSLSGRGPG